MAFVRLSGDICVIKTDGFRFATTVTTPPMIPRTSDAAHVPGAHAPRHDMRLGVDIVQIGRIAESLERFGERFVQRLFTHDEVAYATSAPEFTIERLASRFAAKEAAIKAFDLGHAGVDWREIEVRTAPDGACRLVLHGKAAQLAGLPSRGAAVSMSHDGQYATAVVFAA